MGSKQNNQGILCRRHKSPSYPIPMAWPGTSCQWHVEYWRVVYNGFFNKCTTKIFLNKTQTVFIFMNIYNSTLFGIKIVYYYLLLWYNWNDKIEIAGSAIVFGNNANLRFSYKIPKTATSETILNL